MKLYKAKADKMRNSVKYRIWHFVSFDKCTVNILFCQDIVAEIYKYSTYYECLLFLDFFGKEIYCNLKEDKLD